MYNIRMKSGMPIRYKFSFNPRSFSSVQHTFIGYGRLAYTMRDVMNSHVIRDISGHEYSFAPNELEPITEEEFVIAQIMQS